MTTAASQALGVPTETTTGASIEETAVDTLNGWPMISVVVPVRNEELHLAHTIKALLGQDYPAGRSEILVVDGCSTDATREIAQSLADEHPELRVFDNPRRLSSAARNVGIEHARGELILIVDGHCQIDGQNLFREVAAAFEQSGADCLGRPQPLDVTNATPWQRAIASARSSWLGHHPDSFIYSNEPRFVPAKSVAVAYRRSVFEKIGLFDERFDACEDVELNHRIDRAGLRCYFAPRIAVHYQPRTSLSGLFRQMVRYGRGRVRLLKKHPETFSVGGFVPALFLVGLVLGPLAALVWAPLGWAYVAVLACYAALVLGVSLSIAARQRDLSLAPRLALVFPTIHAGSGWGVVREALACAGRASVLSDRPQRLARESSPSRARR